MELNFYHFIIERLEINPRSLIMLFDQGDYCQCFGVDATFVAKNCFKSEAVLKKASFNEGEKVHELLYVTTNKNQMEWLMRQILLVHRHSLQVFTKCKAVNSQGSSESCGFTMSLRASPGNLSEVEDILFGEDCSGAQNFEQVCVVSLQVVSGGEGSAKNKCVALAACDTTRNKFVVSEFDESSDNLPVTETALIQLEPKECLILPVQNILPPVSALFHWCFRLFPRSSKLSRNLISVGPELQNYDSRDIHEHYLCADSDLRELLQRLKIPSSELKRSHWSTSDLGQDLNRLIKFRTGVQVNALALPEAQLKLAMGGVAALISYLGLLKGDPLEHCYHLETFNSCGYMKLDAKALESLSVFPTERDGTDFSLFRVLNFSRTKMGERQLGQWLKQPLVDANLIQERLDIVEALLQNGEILDQLHGDTLGKMPDLGKLARKLGRKKAGLQDCYSLYQTVKRLKTFHDIFGELAQCCTDPKTSVIQNFFIAPLQRAETEFSNFIQLIDTVLDFSKISQEYCFMVKPQFSEQLSEIDDEIKKVERKIEKVGERASITLGLEFGKSFKVEASQQHGQLFRVTKKDEKLLRGSHVYTTIDSQRGGVRFTNPELTELNEEYLELRGKYEELQASVVSNVLNITQTYLDPLHRLTDFIATVDVFVSLAIGARNAPIAYTRPQIRPMDAKAEISLRNARHPCIEAQGNVDFIPNDVDLSENSQILSIVSGPNMGGKSTYIRQVAVICLMAQIGSFVPCEEGGIISCRDAIFARVGASDSALKGVSTFMGEMLETSNILMSATSHSLIIIDELGRGTSTFDGFGLAWSIALSIATKIKAFCLFATHFHELSELANQNPSLVKNEHLAASCEKGTLTLLYKVRPGASKESFGINIAQMTNMPTCIIKKAQELAAEMEGIGFGQKCHFEANKDFLKEVREILVSERENPEKILIYLKNLVSKHSAQLMDAH